jgi:large conductance mechanosensitive channel
MKHFFEEFKAFAVRGNVMDLAVAVIIGAAFGKIVTSLVDNILMPAISPTFGVVNLSSLKLAIGPSVLQYGIFLQNALDFVLIALVIFVMIKAVQKLRRRQEEEPEKASPAPEDIQLLREIRDLLQQKVGR